MAEHFIHYLKRKIHKNVSKKEVREFYALNQQSDEGFDRPAFHITKSKKGVATKIKPGDVIWIISIIDTPWGSSNPSLDGKIVVKKIEITETHIKYHAGKSSNWYNFNDITKWMHGLQTINSKESVKNLIDANKNVGQKLQGIRRLFNPGILIKRSEELSALPYDFVSYRMKDGTEHAFSKVTELVKNGEIVFWDRYCLPRRLAERREYVDDEKLDVHLTHKIAGARQVWGIETILYKEKESYSEKEYNLAILLNKYKSVAIDPNQ